ncbi:putative defense protein 3 [Diadema antillarum]|uniref:putative defense protein 3 n=1 Tax=Diadema antillarum TaxID=105358 RepID=UPI003A870513
MAVSRTWDLLRLVCFFLLAVGLVGRETWAYPTGAPKQACPLAMPSHHARDKSQISPQPKPSPYSFVVNAKEYKVGQKIEVTIETKEVFTGFMIQARRAGGGETPVGNFTALPPNSKLLGCNASDDSVTHSNPGPKQSGMTFTWSTKQPVGTIQFFGSVAKDHDTFWANITSANITLASETKDGHLLFDEVEDKSRMAWVTILHNRTRSLVGLDQELLKRRGH